LLQEFLIGGDGSDGGEVGGEGAQPGGEVSGGIGQRGQRVLVVVAREVGPCDRHEPLRRRHRRRGGRAGRLAAANGGGRWRGEKGRQGRRAEAPFRFR